MSWAKTFSNSDYILTSEYITFICLASFCSLLLPHALHPSGGFGKEFLRSQEVPQTSRLVLRQGRLPLHPAFPLKLSSVDNLLLSLLPYNYNSHCLSPQRRHI